MGLLEFAAGWALGAKSGESHLDEVIETAKGVVHSQEVTDLLHAVRNHVGYSLKELGGLVMGNQTDPKAGDDLLDIVRLLVQRRDGSASAGSGPPGLQIVRDAFREKRGAS